MAFPLTVHFPKEIVFLRLVDWRVIVLHGGITNTAEVHSHQEETGLGTVSPSQAGGIQKRTLQESICVRVEPGTRKSFLLLGGGRRGGSLTFCHPCTTGILPREPRRLRTAGSPSVPRARRSP